MRTALLAVASLCVVAASVIPPHKVVKKPAEKEQLVKMKTILELLVRVEDSTLYSEHLKVGSEYKIEEHLDKYKLSDPRLVKYFVQKYNKGGMIHEHEWWSILDEDSLEEAKMAYKLLVGSVDWETFYSTACWMREHLHPGMFVYAFVVAVKHRPDTSFVELPPLYEIAPSLFITHDVLLKAYEHKVKDVDHVKKTVVIPANFTNMKHEKWGITPIPTYMTEDVELNTFHAMFHYSHPFWMPEKEVDRKGELFWFSHQQMLARYELERLSMGLPEVEMLAYDKPIDMGYVSELHLGNGDILPPRPDHTELKSSAIYEDAWDMYWRLKFDIDAGHLLKKEGDYVKLTEKDGMHIIGETIEGSEDIVNHGFYGSLYNMMRKMVARVVDPEGIHGVAPGPVEFHETAMRDPAYYSVLKRIDHLVKRYKHKLHKYTTDELTFPGVKVESIEIDKLVTYWNTMDVDLMNTLPITTVEEIPKVDVKARVPVLDHKPFTYKIHVKSDKDTAAMVRVFIGPKTDAMGKVPTLEDMKDFMVEIDRFPAKLRTGATVIERNSEDSNVVSDEWHSHKMMLKKVSDAVDGKTVWEVPEKAHQCGLPKHLLLPKGSRAGTPFTLFVMVTPLEGDIPKDLPHGFTLCGLPEGVHFPDTKPMGFPFDRELHHYDFVTPNMIFKDVVIFHKRPEDIH